MDLDRNPPCLVKDFVPSLIPSLQFQHSLLYCSPIPVNKKKHVLVPLINKKKTTNKQNKAKSLFPSDSSGNIPMSLLPFRATLFKASFVHTVLPVPPLWVCLQCSYCPHPSTGRSLVKGPFSVLVSPTLFNCSFRTIFFSRPV